jgi:pimeloyl-ACP methyl ester carboxylesterase
LSRKARLLLCYKLAMATRTIETPNVTFEALEEGGGPLVLCLHGFPDDARSWRHQVPALVEAGFRVVAPFMRGYAPTSAPADGRFDAMALGEDVAALLEALGAEDAVVIGHDWGAAATYFGALLASQRMRKIVTLAVPYGPGFFRALRESYAQQRRSWYMLFFQHALADEALARDDFAMVEHLYRDWSPSWRPPREALRLVQETLSRPGTLQAALGYYRHTMRPVFDDPGQLDVMLQAMGAPLQVPALYLHGAEDGCIGVELARGIDSYFARGVRVEIVEGAGHFLHRERPDVVNRAILDFLSN